MQGCSYVFCYTTGLVHSVTITTQMTEVLTIWANFDGLTSQKGASRTSWTTDKF